MTTSHSIAFVNESDKEVLFYTEPHGEEYRIKPKNTITILANNGESHDRMEICYVRDGVFTVGWEGDGDEIVFMQEDRKMEPFE